jgi:short-chain Z-isoprenyl diphosphate synthase
VANWKDAVRRVLYPAYEARVVKFLPADKLPQHIGVMLDGNRRWAKAVGQESAAGHRAGADNIEPFLGWCDEVGIKVVTLWLL